jgi:hypothetical protein
VGEVKRLTPSTVFFPAKQKKQALAPRLPLGFGRAANGSSGVTSTWSEAHTRIFVLELRHSRSVLPRVSSALVDRSTRWTVLLAMLLSGTSRYQKVLDVGPNTGLQSIGRVAPNPVDACFAVTSVRTPVARLT